MSTPKIPLVVIIKRPCNCPPPKKSWATQTLLQVAEFGVFRFQWVQGGRHYLHVRMQQVCPRHGCFRPGQQSSGYKVVGSMVGEDLTKLEMLHKFCKVTFLNIWKYFGGIDCSTFHQVLS
jgi:hypothetical protein